MTAQAQPTTGRNLMEVLAREIRRVTEIREQYRRLAGMAGVNVAPVMATTEQALEAACVAVGVRQYR